MGNARTSIRVESFCENVAMRKIRTRVKTKMIKE